MCDATHGAGEAGARAAERGAALILLVARDAGAGAIRAQARARRRGDVRRLIRVTERTDAQLVAACRAGDHGAWAELVERYSRYVYAIAVRAYGLAESDAEDVFQEVFARTYERLGALRDDA